MKLGGRTFVGKMEKDEIAENLLERMKTDMRDISKIKNMESKILEIFLKEDVSPLIAYITLMELIEHLENNDPILKKSYLMMKMVLNKFKGESRNGEI
jgi:hypothetical protein